MRISVIAGLTAATCLLIAPAQAVQIPWNLESTVTRTNFPALGPIAVGDTLSVNMLVETDTPGNPIFWMNGYSFLNAIDSFDLTVNGHTLSLGPQSDDPLVARDTNNLGTLNFEDYQLLSWVVRLYDGDTPYVVETRFEFTDLNAFPIGSLPLSAPSLASARLTDFSLYSPVESGGMLFVAGGGVDSLTSPRSVPEPSTFALMLGAIGGLAFARRRRVAVQEG